MVTFCPLFSGSSGNCSLLSYQNTSVLIDAGVSCKRISEALQSRGSGLEQIQGILLTHEHSDHIQGLAIITKRYSIPIYASPEVLDYLEQNRLVAPGSELVEVSGPFQLGEEMMIFPFDTPHDSIHSLGFRIMLSNGLTVGIATDLGFVSPVVWENLQGCDLVALESNYDESMLACSSYPYYLKRRIKSSTGHLSNHECADYLTRLAKSGTRNFVLTHLSQENNLPELAYQTAICQLNAGGVEEEEILLRIARRNEPSELICLP